MKLAALFLLCAAAANMEGCGDDGPASVFAIAYIVDSTGGAATATSISYTASDGSTVDVLNPTLPWGANAEFSSGEKARLVVLGATGPGSTITGRIQDDPGQSSSPSIYGEDTCPANTPNSSIDVQHTF